MSNTDVEYNIAGYYQSKIFNNCFSLCKIVKGVS